MSIAESPPSLASAAQRCRVNLADEALIPAWVTDLTSFRTWAASDDYPPRGRFSFFRGEIWADLAMEQLFSHNLLKTKLIAALSRWVDQHSTGYVFSDGVRLTDPRVELSTEPDLVYVSFDAIRDGRVRLIKGQTEGYVELEGTVDLVVEIVSPSSVRKDLETLRDLYWASGVPEYWLLDARGNRLQFQILDRRADAYHTVSANDSAVLSPALKCAVSLQRDDDPLGNPRFVVELTS
ncbi:MAG: Uma2 family endonuclease [Planctomycetaceae bacterium]|nr:Uma2 family endonuclease [Planctomycetaceae bacterium]